ncbi:MAG: ATP synthase subunit I [Betaproteobacteria bacterium]
MFRIVGLQIAATALVAVIAWAVGGGSAAVSALLGGAACFVPNGLFALRLAVASRRPGGADVATFFVGEFVKLGSTVALLALVASIIVTLKSYLVALAWR